MRNLLAVRDFEIIVDPNKDRWDTRSRAHNGTAAAGSATSLTLNPPAANNNATYAGLDCALVSGPGSAQTQRIASYNGTTKVATVSPAWGPEYLSLPGTAGNYASTPDSAAVSVTGDIDVRVKWAADDWTPAAIVYPFRKYDTAVGGSFVFGISGGSNGNIVFEWVDASATLRSTNSNAAPTVVDGAVLWLRATLDVNNGAGGHTVRFYTSSDGVIWTQLGTDKNTGVFTTSIQDGNANVKVGVSWAGKAYYSEIRNGIDGPVVAKFDPFNDANGSVTSFTSDTSEVWTINQSGSPAAELTGFPDGTTGYEVRLPAGVVQ